MKVLLTGVTGFIGQNLMPMLIHKCPNIDILTLNRDLEVAKSLYPRSKFDKCRHVYSTELDKVIEFNPEVVIHLATLTTPRQDSDIIQPLISANIEFGVLLLDALSKCTNMKLFVNTGSFAEYRYGVNKFDSAYLYAACKTAFRSFVDYYSNLYGIQCVTVIPYSVYGGNMTVKRVFDYIKESMDSHIDVKMTHGEQVLDFIHVDDISNFFVYVITNKERFLSLKENEREFHLGTGKGTSIRDIATIFEKKYKKKCNIEWGAKPYRKRDIMYAVAPIGNNNHAIRWRALIDLREGI